MQLKKKIENRVEVINRTWQERKEETDKHLGQVPSRADGASLFHFAPPKNIIGQNKMSHF